MKLIDAGMSVARLNFSHGDHKAHGNTLANIRAAQAERPGKNIAVMLDTKGPEIRTGMLVGHEPVRVIRSALISRADKCSVLIGRARVRADPAD